LNVSSGSLSRGPGGRHAPGCGRDVEESEHGARPLQHRCLYGRSWTLAAVDRPGVDDWRRLVPYTHARWLVADPSSPPGGACDLTVGVDGDGHATRRDAR